MKKMPAFLLPLLLLWLLAACSQAQPDIEVVPGYDLGTVVMGQKSEADLIVRNLGEGPLNIAAVSTSCGCTTATLSSMSIPPGGQATLHITYDSTAHPDLLGPVRRQVFIDSDDPDEAEVEIWLDVLVLEAQA